MQDASGRIFYGLPQFRGLFPVDANTYLAKGMIQVYESADPFALDLRSSTIKVRWPTHTGPGLQTSPI